MRILAENTVKAEDLGELPLVSNPVLSPDQRLTAYILTRINLDKNRYESSIWLVDHGGETWPLTGGTSDKCPAWNPNGTMLAFLRSPDDGKGSEIMLIRREGGEAWKLAVIRHGASSLSWDPEGRFIYALSRAPLGGGGWKDYRDRDVLEVSRLPVWFNGEGFIFDRFTGLYRVEVPSGRIEELVHGSFDISSYAVSPNGGKIAYARTYDELKPHLQRLMVLDLETGSEERLLEGYSIVSIEWSPRGDMLAVIARSFGKGFASHYKVHVINLRGREAKCVTCRLRRNALNTAGSDVRGPSCSKNIAWPEDKWIYFQISDAGRTHLYRASPEGEVEPVITPDCGVVDEFSAGRRVLAYTYMDPASPKELYLLEGGEAKRLTRHTETWVKRRVLGRQRRIDVRTRDGLSIDAWILEPAVKPNGAWVLYIHGGPKMMHGCGFMHEYHVLSGAGYTLILPNPRGSDGYSEEFADIRGGYGDKDYQDLMDVYDAMVGIGLDPGKAGVAGGSYGGFMTNWIIGHTNRFKAAVTQRSISNWTSKYGTTDIGFYYNKEQIGRGLPPWRSHEEYWFRSPLRYVDGVETPLLIIHSLEDYRCWLDQALQLYTALKEKGVEVKMLLFPEENHNLSRSGKPRRRVARIKAIKEWFDKHLLGEASSNNM